MFLWFVTYILIPVYTILFVKGNNWLTTNFSVIGNRIGKKEAFVLWGLIVGIYFLVIENDRVPHARRTLRNLVDSAGSGTSFLCGHYPISSRSSASKIFSSYRFCFYGLRVPDGMPLFDCMEII